MPERIASVLARQLLKVGFAPDPLLSELVFARVHKRGIAEAKKLPLEYAAAPELWPPLRRLLGIGAAFTEFLTAGIAAPGDFARGIASLGALANAIYALGDWLVDSGCSIPAMPKHLGELVTSAAPETHDQLLVALMKQYLQSLERLGRRNQRIKDLVIRALTKLHAAELASADTEGITRTVWWRKSALPVFVLGLPAWISVASDCRVRYESHVRWLGLTGEFTGWVDDFADYEDDCSSGHANRLKPLNRDSILRVAAKVAEQGRQVLRFWDGNNKHVTMRNTFMVMIWSWLAIDRKPTHPPEAVGSGSRPPVSSPSNSSRAVSQ